MSIPAVIYESSEFLVINKPAGLLVHRTRAKKKKEEEPTVVDWILENRPEIKSVGDDPETRPGIVHRIDRETSGILVIAKTQVFFDYLKELFKEKKVKKTYLALVYGVVQDDKGIIDKPIGLKGGTIKRTVHGGKMIKEAITEFKVIRRFEELTLVEASPKTGRTHQIRVHLASIGHPIVGDSLYGGKKQKKSSTLTSRQFLHARSIEFESAPGHKVSFSADLPDDLARLIKELK
ncbi:MAG: RNA pseudouridine synthase [Candidatus Colwellbacteria bacterium]|nr:RNA pseudouridine synthase [Candidatus Colwellbacteria bacterium]